VYFQGVACFEGLQSDVYPRLSCFSACKCCIFNVDQRQTSIHGGVDMLASSETDIITVPRGEYKGSVVGVLY